MKEFRGKSEGKGKRIGIVVSRFNEIVTQNLLSGALSALQEQGVQEIEVFWVPGAFEIPLVLKRLARSGRFDGLIALGAVIRGETPHFEYVAGEAASGTARVAYDFDLPVGFGILTTETLEQALNRAGGKAGNKGREAALAVLETLNLLDQVRS